MEKRRKILKHFCNDIKIQRPSLDLSHTQSQPLNTKLTPLGWHAKLTKNLAKISPTFSLSS